MLKFLFYILIAITCNGNLFAQYYLRGEVKDEQSRPLANTRLLLHSTGYLYYSGNQGGFGIVSTKRIDSLTISIDGFQTLTVAVSEGRYAYITLKLLSSLQNLQKKRLISFTRNMTSEEMANWSVGGETYSNLVENEFIQASKYPETGFAINIDKASYSNVRRFINMNSTVPPDAVRIEEMLNYFNFDYKKPSHDSIFSYESHLTGCPWNTNNQLLILKVCASQVDLDKVPPSNLVFLIDISGSMDMPNRLPLLKSAFKLMVNNLRDKDTVSIVVYGSTVGVWMQPTSGRDKQKITRAIEELSPGGATAGASGITMAYSIAKSKFIAGGNNRVILATDGDFNVGQTSEDQLENIITQHRQTGIYLTCLGVGMGNYKDSKLEILAKKGNGNFAYLDDEKEAEKVLVKELTQTLYTVADDAYLTISFNPAFVKQYRLIGFDNKLNAISDSTSELEGGEVGSGHTLLAMVEIVPANVLNVVENSSSAKPFAKLLLDYKTPRDSVSRTSVYNCPGTFTAFEDLEKSYRFATSVVIFGSLLKNSRFAKTISWNDAVLMANECYNEQDPLQKEFLELLEKAKKIYGKQKRKKRA